MTATSLPSPPPPPSFQVGWLPMFLTRLTDVVHSHDVDIKRNVRQLQKRLTSFIFLLPMFRIIFHFGHVQFFMIREIYFGWYRGTADRTAHTFGTSPTSDRVENYRLCLLSSMCRNDRRVCCYVTHWWQKVQSIVSDSVQYTVLNRAGHLQYFWFFLIESNYFVQTYSQ